MNYKVIKASQINEEDSGVIKVKQLLNHKEITNISIAKVKINGVNKKIINRSSDALYYVLEGKGCFTVSDEEVLVETGDVIYIPRGIAYFDSGQMTLLAINTPRFEIGQTKILN